MRNALGVVPVSGSDSYDNVIPYWRVALEHQLGDHYLEVGTFGLATDKAPGGNNGIGTDHITDVALDATYNYTGIPDNILTGYVTYIHEKQYLGASSLLLGTNTRDTLSTFRVNGSYSFENTYTLSGQRFQTTGTSDVNEFAAAPNSAGWNMEIAYVPSGHAKTWFPDWINARLSLQYTAYDKFNGTSSHAGDNNTLYLLLWIAG